MRDLSSSLILRHCLIVVVVLLTAQLSQPVHVADAASAVCVIELRGAGGQKSTAGPLSQARLSCSGGPVLAASDDPAALALMQRSSKGITWTKDLCGLAPKTCVLALCGGADANAQIQLQLSVRNVSDPTRYLWSVVCIGGRTRAVVETLSIMDNTVSGLAINGSASVQIRSSSFVNNVREVWSGAALIVDGHARVVVADTNFTGNQVPDEYNYGGGAILAQGSSHVDVTHCAFASNLARWGYGGAVNAVDNSTVSVRDSNFSGHIAMYGGVVCTAGSAAVTLQGCQLENNWGSFGGAVYAYETSSITLVDSTLVSNYVKDYDTEAAGGAAYVNDSASLNITNTTVRNNSAQTYGGGVAMGGSEARLYLGDGTRITGNSARQGGGLYITRLLDNMTHAAHITVRNKAVISDDIGVELMRLDMLSERQVSAFRPLLGNNKGLLRVRLNLTGPGGLPGSAAIQAVLAGRPLARNMSDPVTGEALLNINLQEPPGTYRLVFEVMAMNDELHTDMNVTVVPCGPGELALTDEQACQTCPKGSYSLDPLDPCRSCPANAACEGSIIVPKPGFWSSSLRSDQIHRCLYPPACAQNHNATELLAGQDMDLQPATAAGFLKTQCADGHEGNLCGQCSANYGQRMSITVGRCQPCAAAAHIVIIYLLAAAASMVVIKYLCFTHSQEAAKHQATVAKQKALSQTASVPPPVMKLSADSDAAMAAGSGLKPKASDQGTSQGQAAQQPCVGTAGAPATVVPAGHSPVPPGDLLKPFMVYLQWMMVVASINLDWPKALSGPYAAVAWLFAASSTSVGLDCLLSQSPSAVPLSARKVLFALLLPVGMLALLLGLDALLPLARDLLRRQRRFARSRARSSQQQAGVYAQTSIVLLFFFLPSLLRATYGLFACVSLDQPVTPKPMYLVLNAPGSYWLMDSNQPCFMGYHRGWALGVGVPMLLLLCVAVPLGVVAYLLRSGDKLQDDPYYMQHYGFLYLSYKPSRCFWEGVVALQTCVIVAISVFGVTLGVPFQCILLAAAFGTVQLLLAAFRPYVHQAANQVMVQACSCLQLSVLAALALSLLALLGSSDGPAANGVAVVVLVFNIIFALSVVWRLCRAIDWSSLSSSCGRLCQAAGSACKGSSSGRRAARVRRPQA